MARARLRRYQIVSSHSREATDVHRAVAHRDRPRSGPLVTSHPSLLNLRASPAPVMSPAVMPAQWVHAVPFRDFSNSYEIAQATYDVGSNRLQREQLRRSVLLTSNSLNCLSTSVAKASPFLYGARHSGCVVHGGRTSLSDLWFTLAHAILRVGNDALERGL
jgi:hypothetical protein